MTEWPKSPVNHVLHLLITVFTVGLWFFVWMFLILTHGKSRRVMIGVDEAGEVHYLNR